MNGSYKHVELLCTVDFENTPESLHAHAIPENVEIRPGDVVMVHGAPAFVAFGERLTCQRRATLIRANLFTRIWTEFRSIFEIAELYEVGFQAQESHYE